MQLPDFGRHAVERAGPKVITGMLNLCLVVYVYSRYFFCISVASQGPFLNTLRNHAWLNHYYIVSATGENAQIIDMTGDVIALDGEFARWVCASVNLEKEFLHIWPHTLKFKDIQKKYGRKISFKIYHPENWATLEGLDPDVKVRDILKEYEIPTYDEQLREATEIQKKYRL